MVSEAARARVHPVAGGADEGGGRTTSPRAYRVWMRRSERRTLVRRQRRLGRTVRQGLPCVGASSSLFGGERRKPVTHGLFAPHRDLWRQGQDGGMIVIVWPAVVGRIDHRRPLTDSVAVRPPRGERAAQRHSGGHSLDHRAPQKDPAHPAPRRKARREGRARRRPEAPLRAFRLVQPDDGTARRSDRPRTGRVTPPARPLPRAGGSARTARFL